MSVAVFKTGFLLMSVISLLLTLIVAPQAISLQTAVDSCEVVVANETTTNKTTFKDYTTHCPSYINQTVQADQTSINDVINSYELAGWLVFFTFAIVQILLVIAAIIILYSEKLISAVKNVRRDKR
jgi:disulfide bond formation protein DsbB